MRAELARMTWSEVERYVAEHDRSAVAVWPWGSIEQHGPRMLIETDALFADHFAQRIAEKRDVLVLPSLTIGMSRQHTAFPGTVSIPPEVAVSIAASVLRSVHQMGVRKLFALLGHSGNVKPFQAAVHALGKEVDGLIVTEPLDAVFQSYDGELGMLLDSFGEPSLHASAAECSLLYAILAAHGRDNEVQRLGRIPIDDEMVTVGVSGQGAKGDPQRHKQMFPFGAMGDQRKADIVKGQRILALIEEAILGYFDEFVSHGH